MLRLRVRTDCAEIKVVEACEDGNNSQAENDAKDPTCSYQCEFAAPQYAELMLHSGCIASTRQQTDCIYQEEAPVPACAAVQTAGTQVVAGTVLSRVDHESIVVLGEQGGHNGP